MTADANASGYGDALFRVKESSRVGWARLSVSGELDLATALTFRRRLRALKASNSRVRLDLSEVEFIDSAGAHAVLDAVEASAEGPGRVEVEPEVSGPVRRYFDSIKAAGFPSGL